MTQKAYCIPVQADRRDNTVSRARRFQVLLNSLQKRACFRPKLTNGCQPIDYFSSVETGEIPALTYGKTIFGNLAISLARP